MNEGLRSHPQYKVLIQPLSIGAFLCLMNRQLLRLFLSKWDKIGTNFISGIKKGLDFHLGL